MQIVRCNDRTIWQRFSTLRAPFGPKVRIHFAEVTRFGFHRTIGFLALGFSKSAAGKLANCAKLLEILGGEVAEWFKAPVC
jgi:hypothetical protein